MTRVLRPVWLLCLTTALLLSGCEEDVTAVLGSDRPFTLFGVLTPQTDSQWVRVFPIEDVLSPLDETPLDARFTSLARRRQETFLWQDSLIRERDGQVAHVFWAPFRADFGETYVLEVAVDENARTSVEVTVPPESRLVLPPVQLTPPALFTVRVEGLVPNLIRLEVVYTFKFKTFAGIDRDVATVSYQGTQTRTLTGWQIELNIPRDRRMIQDELRQRINLDTNAGIKIVRIEIRMIAANAEWDPPGGIFDPEVLVQPGTLTNVRNGFGFVGAGYRLHGLWVPQDTFFTAPAQ